MVTDAMPSALSVYVEREIAESLEEAYLDGYAAALASRPDRLPISLLAAPEVVTVFAPAPSGSEATEDYGEPIVMDDGTVFRVTGIYEVPSIDSDGRREPEELMPATRKLMELFPELYQRRTKPEVGLALQAALAELAQWERGRK